MFNTTLVITHTSVNLPNNMSNAVIPTFENAHNHNDCKATL